MASTGEPNQHANIMLDLETTSFRPNAGIIEIGAVYFDINTGAELKFLKTPVNLKSCLDNGLVQDDETLNWLKKKIPETLANSKTTEVTLEDALGKLNSFVEDAIDDAKQRLQEAGKSPDDCKAMVWGNGAVADNAWIRNAYMARGWLDKGDPKTQRVKAWKHTNDMCMRTIVTAVKLKTGWDHARIRRGGKHHDALEDCRHQIKYFVPAWKEFMGTAKRKARSNAKPSTAKPSNRLSAAALNHPDYKPYWRAPGGTAKAKALKAPEKEVHRQDVSNKENVPNRDVSIAEGQRAPATRPALPTPNTSFSEADAILDFFNISTPSYQPAPKRKRSLSPERAAAQPPSELITPNESFSDTDEDVQNLPVSVSKRSAVEQATADPSPSSSPAYGTPRYPIVPFNQPNVLRQAKTKNEDVPVYPSEHWVTKQDHLSIAATVAIDTIPSPPPACDIQPSPTGHPNPDITPTEVNTTSYKGLVSLSPGTLACFLHDDDDDEFADLPPSLILIARRETLAPIATHLIVDGDPSKAAQAVIVGERSMSDAGLSSLLKKEDVDPCPSSPTPSVLRDHNIGTLDMNVEMFRIDGS